MHYQDFKVQLLKLRTKSKSWTMELKEAGPGHSPHETESTKAVSRTEAAWKSHVFQSKVQFPEDS